MRTRLVLFVIGLIMAGALVAGCGDDNNDTSSDSAATQSTDTGASSGGDTSTEEGGSSGGANPSGPQVQQAVESCKQQIGAQPGLSEDVKSDLEKICEKAASGDEKEVREATKQVCIKLIEENVPEGPAREQALASCDQ